MNILLTGAGGIGFGSTLYKRLKARGHRVWGISLEGPDEVVDFRCFEDIDESVYDLMQHAEGELGGPIHTLINSAGTNYMDWIDQHDSMEAQDLFMVNYFVPAAFTRMMAEAAIEDSADDIGNRRVVNICSMGTQFGLRCCSSYVASKAALEAFTRTVAKETSQRCPNLTIVGVSPMSVKPSAMDLYCQQRMVEIRGMTPEQAAAYSQQSPMGPSSHASICDLIEYAMEAPVHCNGTIFRQAGGMGLYV